MKGIGVAFSRFLEVDDDLGRSIGMGIVFIAILYTANPGRSEHVKIDNDIMALANPEIAKLPDFVIALVGPAPGAGCGPVCAAAGRRDRHHTLFRRGADHLPPGQASLPADYRHCRPGSGSVRQSIDRFGLNRRRRTQVPVKMLE